MVVVVVVVDWVAVVDWMGAGSNGRREKGCWRGLLLRVVV